MKPSSLPWILLAAVAVGWAGTAWYERSQRSSEIAVQYTAEDIADMKRQIAELRARTKAQENVAAGAANAAAGPAPTRPPPGNAARWARGLRSPLEAERAEAEAEVVAALEGTDARARLEALTALRGSPAAGESARAWRARVAPLLAAEQADVRYAALIAATHLDPQDEDLAAWIAMATAGRLRGNPETITRMLVRAAGGRVEGEVAEAVVSLLRDDRLIKRAPVIRGLEHFKTLAPSVRTRLLDVVETSTLAERDLRDYFLVVAPRLDPKSDRLVDLTLALIATGKVDAAVLLRSLRRGLSDAQRLRVVDTLLDIAETTDDLFALGALLQGMGALADKRHVAALEALASRDDLDAPTRDTIDAVLEKARKR